MNEHLDLYLDGALHGQALADFEARRASDPALRAEVALQRRADQSIRVALPYHPAPPISFAPPVTTTTVGGHSIAGRIAPTVARAGTNWRRLGLAAAVLLGGAGIWAGYVHITTPSFERLIPPDMVYGQLVAGGFKPEFVCIDDAGFAKAVRDRLGTALHLTPAAGIVALGWGYGDDYQGKIVGPRTLVLLATVDGEQVVVLMDRASDDRTLVMPDACGLHLYRAQVGPLVLYEISHFERPRILPLLHE
ncbi:MAG: anti-sigma factor family protein [Phycisphaerales bacterium]